MNTAALLEKLMQPGVTTDPSTDLARAEPDITIDDAYDLQFQLIDRRAQPGDRVAGYQASFTSKAAQLIIPSMPYPMVGSLLASQVIQSGGAAKLQWDRYSVYMIESEVGILLDADLAGPGVTALQARGAVAGIFPAIEVAPVRPGTFEKEWSNQHLVATHNTDSTIVLGDQLTRTDLHLPTEGLTLSIDGAPAGSATAVEAMGDPFTVLAEMANRLGRHGQTLRAGQFVITGSCIAPQHITPETRLARVDCTRIGSVEVRLS
ncbi:2-keto-4-pentenoate hydratase [Streptomyces sp. NPDC002144]